MGAGMQRYNASWADIAEIFQLISPFFQGMLHNYAGFPAKQVKNIGAFLLVNLMACINSCWE